jgi:ubiquinone/menaquinone biosynthesis C-methylase UbiE
MASLVPVASSAHLHPGHQHPGLHAPHHPAADDLAELLDLDAQVLGRYLGEVVEWAASHAPGRPRRIVDLGAGTGVGSLALARRFDAAEVVAVDRSAAMLERVRAAAQQQGLAGRLRTVQADLDRAWPPGVGMADVVWASSSLHEVADPDDVLRETVAALTPRGLLVVVEMDSLPRFLPDAVAPGLEDRCADVLARAGWNAHPDWRPHLRRAGLEVVAEAGFPVEAAAEAPTTERYARAWLRRVRAACDGRLAADDLRALDALLADSGPDAVLARPDLVVRGSRTAWAARRREEMTAPTEEVPDGSREL